MKAETRFDRFIQDMREEYGFPEFEPGSLFYIELSEIRETIRKMADEVSFNSGIISEYQDYEDFWNLYESLMSPKNDEKINL